MNVLIYAGNGTSARGVAQTQATLSELLTPYASITLVKEPQLFANQPWQQSTSLVVFPGGRDLPYCKALKGAPIDAIFQWVRQGGKYLGLCAGAYFASSRVEFEENDNRMAVVGPRDLKLYPGIKRGCAFKGFVYESEKGAKLANLKVEVENFKKLGVQTPVSPNVPSYYNGGGILVDANELHDQGVTVLARYNDPVDVEGGDAAIVHVTIGKGAAILSGVHPE